MQKNYDNKPTSSASAAASDERISVVKLSKSGGCADRDQFFMKAVCEAQIRSYFFGNPIPSTASAALSLSSASSTTNITLSPHAQQLDFGTMSVYAYNHGGGAGPGPDNNNNNNNGNNDNDEDDDDDDYDPAQLDSFLPGDAGDNAPNTQEDETPGLHTPPAFTDPTTTTTTLQKVPPPTPPSMLANTLLAITHASSTASPSEVCDASIMGFLYVADVDGEKGKVRVLAPMGGRVPPRAVVWGKEWPAEVVGLVG